MTIEADLCTFVDKKEAARAYDRKVLEMKGANAVTDFPASEYGADEGAAATGEDGSATTRMTNFPASESGAGEGTAATGEDGAAVAGGVTRKASSMGDIAEGGDALRVEGNHGRFASSPRKRVRMQSGGGALPFVAARVFARTLGLTGWAEWIEYRTSGKLPSNIPSKPDEVYRYAGWESIDDWLGSAAASSPSSSSSSSSSSSTSSSSSSSSSAAVLPALHGCDGGPRDASVPPLVPPAKAGTRWSTKEHDVFVECLTTYGKDWKKAAEVLKTRTATQVRTYHDGLWDVEKGTERASW